MQPSLRRSRKVNRSRHRRRCARQVLIRRLRQAAALCCAAAAAASAWAQQAGQAELSLTRLTAGIHVITAEVASDDPSRMQGLMFRQGLLPNHGMLFVFDDRAVHCMWMRNTLIPLSVAFIDDDGTIANIEEMAPRTDDSHCARHPVRYALEMAAGWYPQHGIQAGSKLGRLGKP
jgi:uncharacterized membrane protein (UPF0127 family)